MKISEKNNGIKIGLIFTIGSLFLTLTFVIPIISVLPGVIAEELVSAMVDNDPYSNVGRGVIFLLSAELVIAIILFLIFEKKEVKKGKQINNGSIYLFMTIIYFILHPLGFYIYWGIGLNFRSDGQLIFGAMNSFPMSSIGFVIIGYVIDLIKNTATNKLFY